MPLPSLVLGAWSLVLCLCPVARGQDVVVPLTAAHAHNDYLHPRPLLDALEQGFCSVEADIFLSDGRLLVAHERSRTQPDRTLQALYLDPLRQRMKLNGGRIYRGGPQFTLLIDLKTNWRQTYPVLRQALQDYSDLFSSFGAVQRTNAVIAILTGDRSLTMFAGETTRYAAYDGELADLDSNSPVDLIPWISTSWGAVFKWRGGIMPEPEQTKLRSLVDRAHRQGRKLRFWGAPDQRAFWEMLRQNGVDIINTDDLTGLRAFLNGK